MKKYIGDRHFYAKILAIMIPIMLQNGITNFVSMLDNIMVGRLGTAQMSGVAVANQLVTVYNLCMFGAVVGAGIFGAQFYGRKDFKNFCNTFRFKVIFCVSLTLICIGIMLLYGGNLCSLYLKGEGSSADAENILKYALKYIKIIVIGFVPYGLSQAYASTLRETGETLRPMIASFVAVAVNLVLNYLLIFGSLGAPKLGVAGAAIATVVSRFAEVIYLAVYSFRKREQLGFIMGFFKYFKIPVSLAFEILKKAFPLMLNEAFWAFGNAFKAQSLSLKGLDVVAANNICDTFWLVLSVTFMAVGSTIAIMVGQLLGAGNHEAAKDTDRKLIFFAVMISIFIGGIFALLSGVIPKMYNTTPAVREMTEKLIIIAAISMPLDSFSVACYFTLRSGGKVLITMLFDSGFICLVICPIAFVLAHFTNLSVYWIYAATVFSPILKCVPGYLLVKKGVWIKTLGNGNT